MTSLQIIKRAMRSLGLLPFGVDPGPDVSNEWLGALNGMIGRWRLQELTMYVLSPQTFDLVSGQGGLGNYYTIGTGGDFDIERPVAIERASVISYNNPSQPLELPLTVLMVEEEQAIPVKDVQSALPQELWYWTTFPLGRIVLWPIPNVTTLKLRLWLPTPIERFEDFTTDHEFPPGYEDALVYNLAKTAGPTLNQVTLSEDSKDLAQESLMLIKRGNIRPTTLSIDPMLVNRMKPWDWRTGQ